MTKDLPNPDVTVTPEEELKQEFLSMYQTFTEEARKKTGYAIHPQIGPDGAFNIAVKVPDDEKS